MLIQLQSRASSQQLRTGVSMTAAILLLILGVVLILTGIIGVLVYPRLIPVGERWQRLVVAVLGVTLLVPGLALAFRTDGPQPDTTTSSTTTIAGGNSTTAATGGKISAPPPGRVPQLTTATGTVHGVPDGHAVFLLLQAGRLYLQGGALHVLPDGRWSTMLRFGEAEDVGRTFMVHLVEAGPAGNEKFSAYLRDAQQTGARPGMAADALPGDVKFLDSVTVVRA